MKKLAEWFRSKQKNQVFEPIFQNRCQKNDQADSKTYRPLLILAAGLLIQSCSYKSPETETPVPSDEGTPKSFFVQSVKDEKTGEMKNLSKTFLCGWASEMETGWSAEDSYSNNVMVPSHCNLAFEITENKLVGKLINPSFPNDPSRWEIALTIPISNHYYLENEKDSAGRDTKKVIKNSRRSHWSARTHMDLNLSGINFEHKWAPNLGVRILEMLSGAGNINVEKVEWDHKNGFLGFTLNKGSYGSEHNKIRFNILAFEHDSKFKKTPFNDQNYKRMNVLHIIGEKAKGLYPILHAAHWDLSKKHELRMWKVPEKYKPVVKEVVSDWNKAFQKIGAVAAGVEPFVLIEQEKENEHAFDLRYPTIAWIDDEKISSYSALGVGMALADVKNGEIKWGMITLYGGMIESYVKSFSPSTSESQPLGKVASLILNEKMASKNLSFPASMKPMSILSSLTANKTNSEMIAKGLSESFVSADYAKKYKTKVDPNNKQLVKQIQDQAAAQPLVRTEDFSKIISGVVSQAQNLDDQSSLQQSHQSYAELLKQVLFKDLASDDREQSDLQGTSGKVVGSAADKEKLSVKARLVLKYSGPNFCQGRTFADVADGWSKARAEMKGTLADEAKVLRHVVKELITHEYGHFLGLGHQFKENILPQKGTVPDAIYNKLAENAKPENGFTNYTSVMGYRDPKTEVAQAQKEDILPGVQDLLVLRYIYRQQYSTYKAGDADFTFFDISENGIIPDKAPGKPELVTSYFPQCNDIEASLALDPYCNRFDRGYNATTIVDNYFSSLNDTMIQNLFAFTDARGGCPECVEGRLWSKSLSTLGRTRLFYDYMRLYYKNEIDKIRGDEEALMDFSNACQTGETRNATLKQIFADKPQLKDLCQANAHALEEMKKLVSKKVVDFTRKDFLTRYAPGGMDGGDAQRDWSRFTGSWTEMTGVPLKLASLYALSTGVPWMAEYGMWGVPLYDDPNYKFGYSFLYPKEYTKIIAANVTNNLHFASLTETERTSMGPSILSMGWFKYMSEAQNNDAGLFPAVYVEKIRNQQKFDFSLVAILMKGRKKDDNPNYVVSFDGVVYDFNTNQETPLDNAYLLPGGVAMVSASNMFLYPITRFTPYSDTDGFLYAYKLNYVRDYADPLSESSVKTDLMGWHDRLVNACIVSSDGVNNGLSQFFRSNVPEFKGFKMSVGLARGEEKRKEFLDSIDEAYGSYYKYDKFSKVPRPETCRESLRGLGLIISSAAVMNGIWLPEIMDYTQK